MNKAASAYGFEIAPGGQGVIFTLSGNAKRDRCQAFGTWEAHLRRDIPRICVRGSVPDLQEPLDEVIKAAHEIAQTAAHRLMSFSYANCPRKLDCDRKSAVFFLTPRR